jgi:hypothetical protein
VSESVKIYDRLSCDQPFLATLTAGFRQQRIFEIANFVATSKSLSPELMRAYLAMIRVYYFQGGYDYSQVAFDSTLITNHFSGLFHKAQTDIRLIIDNLQHNLLNFQPHSQCTEATLSEPKSESFSPIILHDGSSNSAEGSARMIEESHVDAQLLHQRKLLKKYNLSRNECY